MKLNRASISLIREDTAKCLLGTRAVSATSVQVVSATGEPIPVLGCANFHIRVGPIAVYHPLIVVRSLITPVILGIDFMQAHGLVLDFTTTPVHVTNQQSPKGGQSGGGECHVLQAARKTKARACAVQKTSDLSEETIDECAIPRYGEPVSYDMPTCTITRFACFEIALDRQTWQSTCQDTT